MRSKKEVENEDPDAGPGSESEGSGLSAGYLQAQQLLNAERPGTEGGPAPNQPRPPAGEPTFCRSCGSPLAKKASLCSKCGAEPE
jgi:hypothetical protein